MTPVAVDQIDAVAVLAGIRGTVVFVRLAVDANVSRWTAALVVAESVMAYTTMLAGVGQTFVGLLSAAETLIAVRTQTLKPE